MYIAAIEDNPSIVYFALEIPDLNWPLALKKS